MRAEEMSFGLFEAVENTLNTGMKICTGVVSSNRSKRRK